MVQVLIKNVNLVDVTRRKTVIGADILTEGNRIKAVGSALPAPEGASVYDLAGCWAMPGLINMHEHQSYKRLIGPLYGENGACTGLTGVDLGIRGVRTAFFSLKCGITTVCEMGALCDLSYAMKRAIDQKVIPGPRMFVSGQHITMKGGHSYELAREISSAEEMTAAANEMLDKGGEWVKLLTSHEPTDDGNDGPIRAEMPEELVRRAVEIAHRRGARVAVHAMGEKQLQRVINAGVDAIHHGAYLTVSQAKQMREKGIALVSTISAYRNTSSPYFQRGEQWARENMVLRPGFRIALESAMEGGVLIAPGTDSLGDLVDELVYMHRFGMSVWDCLRSATLNGAEILGEKERIGSVEEGKLADLVILTDDPTEDPENLRKILWVMKNGEVYHLPNLSPEHTDPRWLLEFAPMDLS